MAERLRDALAAVGERVTAEGGQAGDTRVTSDGSVDGNSTADGNSTGNGNSTAGTPRTGNATEADVAAAMAEAGVYETLGYEGTGIDVRSEFGLPDARRPDVVTLDSAGGIVTVFEFKRPGTSLTPHESQLAGYVTDVRADYGVLTDGRALRVYERDGETLRPDLRVETTEVTASDATAIADRLGKTTYDFREPEDVARLTEGRSSVRLGDDHALAQEHFFDTFRLTERSSFGRLVLALVELLEAARTTDGPHGNEAVADLFDYWSATYTSVPDDPPSSWDPLVSEADDVETFVFCLETGHALLSRLLLAKAVQDYDLTSSDGWMETYLNELSGPTRHIAIGSYPQMVERFVRDMRAELVSGAFRDDIFSWWTNVDVERTGSLSAEYVTAGRWGDSVADQFGRALGRVFFDVLRFDFADASGDLLGELYQRYFDPETRKALGEFYTPEPLVETILTEAGYTDGVASDRLIDPACGSGTFLVAAVERYLDAVRDAEEDPDWQTHLRRLCTNPRIVGLDVHPFAVVMAQIRFVAAILPAYREAKRADPTFTLRRLPIYRTDALRKEPNESPSAPGEQTELGSFRQGNRNIFVPVPLPVLATDGGAAAQSSTGGGPDGTGTVEVGREAGVSGSETTERTESPRNETPTRESETEHRAREHSVADTASAAGTTEDGFLLRKVQIPRYRTIEKRTDINDHGAYFGVIQGLLDTVQAHLREYRHDPDWDWSYQSGVAANVERYTERSYPSVESVLAPYVTHILRVVRPLDERLSNLRLVDLFEDRLLAVIVKNCLPYEYVVGNPPYVRTQTLSSERKQRLRETYRTATDGFDLYCPFYERGMEWIEGTDTGRLAFVSPNGFFVTAYGRALRETLLDGCLERLYDFRDSGVFDDATNYPAVVVVRAESDPQVRADNDVRCIRVKRCPDDESANAKSDTDRSDTADAGTATDDGDRVATTPIRGGLDRRVIEAIRTHRDDPGYDGRLVDVFDVPQASLHSDPWLLMPPDERRVFERLERHGDTRLDRVTDAVFEGLRTGANGVFVVRVVDADRVRADETGGAVRIEPTGDGEQTRVERDLLRPYLAGRDVTRWRGEWDGLHLLFPYRVTGAATTDGLTPRSAARLVSREELQADLPLTFAYLKSHEATLRGRDGGRWEGDADGWWAYARTQNLARIDQPKTIGAEIADRATFAVDRTGEWSFTTGYGVAFDADHHDVTDVLTAQLNSRVLDFYLKHVAPVKRGGYYSYRARFLDRLPVVTDEGLRELSATVAELLAAFDTRTRIERFPAPYLTGFDGETRHVTHEWQTTRRPVSASVERMGDDPDARFAVTAGRTDRITGTAMDAESRAARQRRATYVTRAVNGRRVRAGETTRIPIPRTDDGVDRLLSRLAADRRAWHRTDVDALESEIDRLVADAFGLSEADQAVIDRFLSTF